MMVRQCFKLVFLLILCCDKVFVQTAKPNIVFVFVDDWGYADVGFRNPALKTPNFDVLANTGLILDRHYVFKVCSPSRASFLTGRWPHHVHQFNIDAKSPLGTNINMTMLPAKLKEAGYSTHMIGKWHQGFYQERFLPVNRGFDTSYGYLTGDVNHMTQQHGCAIDNWKDTAPDPRHGTYDSYVYREELDNIIANHDTDNPLFIYLSLHNVHGPLQAPLEWMDIYKIDSTCEERRTYQAMVSVADNVTGHLVELLKTNGMWSNTLIVVSADNGAGHMGSNYPLKGSKASFFEGGVRASAFAGGGLVPEKMQGKSTEGFIHVSDWYTTFCKLAGVDPTDSGPGKFPVDGLDVWPIITGESTTTPHKEIVLGYDFRKRGAIIVGDYKLIVGHQGGSHTWSPLDYPCKNGLVGVNCDPHCLYNIVKDPGEHNDLSKSEPKKLQELLQRYKEYSKEPRDMQDQGIHSYDDFPKFKGACAYMKKHGGYWQPWEKN